MLIRQDYKIEFVIEEIGSIKQWGFVKVDGNEYPPSVKFRATNIETKEDKVVGTREIETIIDFQVHTETVKQAIDLSEAIRKYRVNKTPITIVGGLPNKEGADNILVIKNSQTLQEFLDRNKIVLEHKSSDTTKIEQKK